MDTFTFLISLLLMIFAVQYGENWLVFAIIAVMILSTRSVGTILLMVISAGVLLYLKSASIPIVQHWPVVVFGLIILALVLGMGEKPSQPEYYSPDPYAGLMGGQQ